MIGSLGFDMSLVQRSRGGDALWHSAYVCGGAARLADGSVVDFSTRNDVIASFIVKPEGTPAWAADCAQLWRRAVAAEKRADAQEARLFELTIPRALPRKHWVKLGRHVARTLADHGMVVQVGIHCPLASDDDINPHIHFVATMREIVDGEFSRKKARHWNKIFHGNAKAVRRR
ncbi:MobA/MobL family protein [Bradyrhizobium diazoefficiens]|nr:MobA/MobL family protein [Bradyrhizobium diazoefficiens]MBR0701994.1 MobA/MobL family protein [Bradyrhizobium diazoefficiens]MBR0770417.1 MobA/MobL family protein [Bradyrhizobium diazoefficiens]